MEANRMIPIGARVAFVYGGRIRVGCIRRAMITTTHWATGVDREAFYKIDEFPTGDDLGASYIDVPEWSIFRSLEEAEEAFESVLRKMKGQ